MDESVHAADLSIAFENRCGKWTKEETEYAEAIMQYFNAGALSDCGEGETLRNYLSRKMRCKPMRFSKKYAGTMKGRVNPLYL